MLERAEPVLKWVCVALGVALVVQSLGMLRRLNPLPRTQVPSPATWSAEVPTNAAPGGKGGPPGMPPGMPMGMAMARGPRGPGTPLPPAIQARVDRVIQSELLGMVMRPPPMALLGIAGQDVFLRAPNGQSGLVREGGELGGVKILKIGVNRVLVSENGQEKELTIFEGIGSESLLNQRKEGTP